MKSILLTGATGFLGSNILIRLLNLKGYQIIVLKRSFSNTFRIDQYIDRTIHYDIDLTPLEEVFKENKVDVILHTATQYGRKADNTRVFDMVDSNLLLPLKLIDLAKTHKVPTFINTDTILDKGVNMYSLSKKQFRDWMHCYSDCMSCINVSIEHFYGANDDSSKFVTYIVDSLANKKGFIDLTAGDQKRDFIYIGDVVDAFIAILQIDNNENGLCNYEIGSGVNIRIKDFVLKVAHILENNTTQLNFGKLPYRENEVMESSVNLNNIRSLGWKSKFSLEEGLKLTIKKGSDT